MDIYRHTRRWQVAGLLVGLPVAVMVGHVSLGRGLLLAAPAFGLCALAGVLAGEATAPRPTSGGRRTAILEVRRPGNYVPVHLARAVAGLTAALVVLLIITTITASSDDLGRAGRALTVTCGSGLVDQGTPWPGSYYSIPLAVLLLAGFGMAAIAFQSVIGRPRPGVDDKILAVDDFMRRRAGRRIVAACGVLVAIPTAGVSLVSSSRLASVGCGSASTTGADVALLALSLVSIGLLGWFAHALAETAVTGAATRQPA
jgi:hypothetical protein